MRVLSIATLFPNAAEPTFGVFVQRRLEQVAKHVDLTVLSPAPWFPYADLLPRYQYRRAIGQTWKAGQLVVGYPRFLSIPRVLKPLDPLMLAGSVLKWLEAAGLHSRFDLIDAQLAYPDGYAAMLIAQRLGCPFTVTLRGHDINELPRLPVRGRQVRTVLRRSARTMAVADALRSAAIELGCPSDRIETIPNGVDAIRFSQCDRIEARQRLGLSTEGRIVLSVGHLVERKGHHLIIEALARLRREGMTDLRLVIVGGPSQEGDFSDDIQACARACLPDGTVSLLGARPNEELKWWYNAVDVFCLASSKEGRANVLLEALACGTPVVATRVWGTPEVITSPEIGTLVERTPERIADGLASTLARPWVRESLTAYAATHTWEAAGERVVAAYHQALADRTPIDGPAAVPQLDSDHE
jgi:teichuronic acid biosynthesis glycosyltransferase TuaC